MPAGGVAAHPKGFAQYANLAAVVKLTDTPTAGVALPDGAMVADLQAEGQDLRFRDDGVDPTSAIGMLIKKDGPLTQYAGDVNKLRIIETAGGGKLNVSYYGI